MRDVLIHGSRTCNACTHLHSATLKTNYLGSTCLIFNPYFIILILYHFWLTHCHVTISGQVSQVFFHCKEVFTRLGLMTFLIFLNFLFWQSLVYTLVVIQNFCFVIWLFYRAKSWYQESFLTSCVLLLPSDSQLKDIFDLTRCLLP